MLPPLKIKLFRFRATVKPCTSHFLVPGAGAFRPSTFFYISPPACVGWQLKAFLPRLFKTVHISQSAGPPRSSAFRGAQGLLTGPALPFPSHSPNPAALPAAAVGLFCRFCGKNALPVPCGKRPAGGIKRRCPVPCNCINKKAHGGFVPAVGFFALS